LCRPTIDDNDDDDDMPLIYPCRDSGLLIDVSLDSFPSFPTQRNATQRSKSKGMSESSPADLVALAAEITRCGDTVKELKRAPGDARPDALKAAVAELVRAKQTYAQHNNGIGLDGKLDTSHMTKAQKKKAAAAAKGEAAAEAPGPAKPVRDK
jgi:hypothetical protein